MLTLRCLREICSCSFRVPHVSSTSAGKRSSLIWKWLQSVCDRCASGACSTPTLRLSPGRAARRPLMRWRILRHCPERWKQCSGPQGLTQTSSPPAEQLSKASCWRNCSRWICSLQPVTAPQHGNPSRKSTGASADSQRLAASSWRERSSCRQSEHAVSSALPPGAARVIPSVRLALLVHGHPDGKVPGIADADEQQNKGGSA